MNSLVTTVTSDPESSPWTELRVSAFKAPLISDSTLTSNQFTVCNKKVVSMMNSELSPQLLLKSCLGHTRCSHQACFKQHQARAFSKQALINPLSHTIEPNNRQTNKRWKWEENRTLSSSSGKQVFQELLDFHSSDGQKHKSKWMIIYHG